MVPMNPAAGQLSPTSSAIALVAVGLQSRPAQGLTSMKCACHAADTAYPDTGLKHEQAGYTFLIVQFRPRSDG